MKEHFKTRQQLANELGFSSKTLYRKLKALQMKVPRGMIPPNLCAEILERIRN